MPQSMWAIPLIQVAAGQWDPCGFNALIIISLFAFGRIVDLHECRKARFWPIEPITLVGFAVKEVQAQGFSGPWPLNAQGA